MDVESVELVEVTHFIATVAGASHPNRNGSSRQEIVQRCKLGERLYLIHEIGNRYDKHATRVVRQNGEQVGYVPKEIADVVVEDFTGEQPCDHSAIALGTQEIFEGSDNLTLLFCIVVAFHGADPQKVEAEIRTALKVAELDTDPAKVLPSGSLRTCEAERASRPNSRGAAKMPPHSRTVGKGGTGCLSVFACLLVFFLVVSLLAAINRST